jgi:hypothetical protein
MNQSELKDFLEEVLQYNTLDFIDSDHRFRTFTLKKILKSLVFLAQL